MYQSRLSGQAICQQPPSTVVFFPATTHSGTTTDADAPTSYNINLLPRFRYNMKRSGNGSVSSNSLSTVETPLDDGKHRLLIIVDISGRRSLYYPVPSSPLDRLLLENEHPPNAKRFIKYVEKMEEKPRRSPSLAEIEAVTVGVQPSQPLEPPYSNRKPHSSRNEPTRKKADENKQLLPPKSKKMHIKRWFLSDEPKESSKKRLSLMPNLLLSPLLPLLPPLQPRPLPSTLQQPVPLLSIPLPPLPQKQFPVQPPLPSTPPPLPLTPPPLPKTPPPLPSTPLTSILPLLSRPPPPPPPPPPTSLLSPTSLLKLLSQPPPTSLLPTLPYSMQPPPPLTSPIPLSTNSMLPPPLPNLGETNLQITLQYAICPQPPQNFCNQQLAPVPRLPPNGLWMNGPRPQPNLFHHNFHQPPPPAWARGPRFQRPWAPNFQRPWAPQFQRPQAPHLQRPFY